MLHKNIYLLVNLIGVALIGIVLMTAALRAA